VERAGCRIVAAHGDGSLLRRLGAIAEGELDDVVADIVRPAGDETDEPPPSSANNAREGTSKPAKLPAITDMK
jgi:hypothetical protein